MDLRDYVMGHSMWDRFANMNGRCIGLDRSEGNPSYAVIRARPCDLYSFPEQRLVKPYSDLSGVVQLTCVTDSVWPIHNAN
jgi:hypothetical protein